MKKLSVKKLVDFRRKKSEKGKQTFVQNLKSTTTEESSESGGDYWTISLSAVTKSLKKGELDLIDEKIDEVQEKLGGTSDTRIKNMYQRNIAILNSYKNMDLKKLRPSGKLNFLKRSTGNPILTIKGLEIEAKPSCIYTFGKQGEEKIGAVWFAAKVNGYSIEEVGIFCDLLFRFLKINYSKKYELTPKYCIAVDMISGRLVEYTKIESGNIAQALNSTLDEINRLL